MHNNPGPALSHARLPTYSTRVATRTLHMLRAQQLLRGCVLMLTCSPKWATALANNTFKWSPRFVTSPPVRAASRKAGRIMKRSPRSVASPSAQAASRRAHGSPRPSPTEFQSCSICPKRPPLAASSEGPHLQWLCMLNRPQRQGTLLLGQHMGSPIRLCFQTRSA